MPPQVVIAIDNPLLRDLLVAILSGYDVSVHVPEDHEDVAGCVLRLRPKVVVCKQKDGHVECLDLIRTLKTRRETRNIPLVVLVTHPTSEHTRHLKLFGCTEVLNMPFDVEDVWDAVAPHIY